MSMKIITVTNMNLPTVLYAKMEVSKQTKNLETTST